MRSSPVRYIPAGQAVRHPGVCLPPRRQPIASIAWRSWSGRFSILDPSGNAIAACQPHGIVRRRDPTTGQFSVHPDSYALELMMPVMSALEAIALAQVLRLVVRAIRTVVIASS